MPEQAIRAALETDPEDVFRTEVLCQWVTAVDAAIPAQVWIALADAAAVQPGRGDQLRFALDVAPDHSSATIAVSWQRPDGSAQVDLADHRSGVDWIVERAAELTKRWHGRLIHEATGTAAFLVPQLQQTGVPVDAVQRRFYAEACAALDAAVTARQLRHSDRPPLNAAVDVARWSTSGEAGQRVLSRKDPQVSPLVATALALHSLTVAPKRSGRFIAF